VELATQHFSSFQSGTGQEKLNGAAVGAYANPLLISPGNLAAPAPGQTIFSTTAYNLMSNTPIANAGVSLDAIFGYAVPLTGSSTGKTIPGIDQHLAGVSAPAPTPAPTTAPVNVTPGTIGNSYLSGWDIGFPNKGTNTISGSTNTVTGGGTGISGSSDSFRYAFTTLTGNGQIVAQLSSLSDPSGSAAAGLMIRSSTAANATAVSLMLNNTNNACLITRASTGAPATYTTTGTSGYKWIKLVRIGNTISAYLSATGSTCDPGRFQHGCHGHDCRHRSGGFLAEPQHHRDCGVQKCVVQRNRKLTPATCSALLNPIPEPAGLRSPARWWRSVSHTRS